MRTMHKLFSLLLLLGMLGCSTAKRFAKPSNQASITPLSLSQISGIDSLTRLPQGRISWQEGLHSYELDLSYLTHRYIYPKLAVFSGKETLASQRGAWAKYMNRSLGEVGIRVQKILLSIPGHLVVFRGFEATTRKRQVDCLLHPSSLRDGSFVVYNRSDYYTTENMAVRELYEYPQKNQILIVDHLRDRNGDGDLSIAYILQDIEYFSPRDKAKYQFFGYREHRNLFSSRCNTYQYIERSLSPITVSLLPTCRFSEFVPRDSSELIPRTFLQE